MCNCTCNTLWLASPGEGASINVCICMYVCIVPLKGLSNKYKLFFTLYALKDMTRTVMYYYTCKLDHWILRFPLGLLAIVTSIFFHFFFFLFFCFHYICGVAK